LRLGEERTAKQKAKNERKNGADDFLHIFSIKENARKW
jgi:hypothetical protein